MRGATLDCSQGYHRLWLPDCLGRRTEQWTERPRGLGDLKKSMTNIVSECSSDVVRDHAMILSDDATPRPVGIFGKDRYVHYPIALKPAALTR